MAHRKPLDRLLSPRRRDGPQPRPIYLVSAAGLPNYGDELITRAWLDWLRVHRPDTPVWLDCPEPGRANHLFAGTHPLLRTTNTLWHLASSLDGVPLEEAAGRAARLVTDLGSPRFDLGLLELREMQSVHLLGGGYLTSVWQHQLCMVAALVALKERFAVRLYATGQGLVPLSSEARALLPGWVAKFDLFEARDSASAAAIGATFGLDDAFLAFANAREIYARRDSPDLMVLLQGDFMDVADRTLLVDAVEAVARSQGAARVGLVESIPPDDSWSLSSMAERGLKVEFYPFARLWLEGLPARAGQTWLSTRFHFHLLAAAVGARGAYLELDAEYYAAKHASLREVGTGWARVSEFHEPTAISPAVDPLFSSRRKEFAARKEALARRIYP